LAQVAKAYRMICEEVKKPENKYEAAATLLGSERPFGQVHLLWKIFGLEEEDSGESNEDEEDGEGDENEDVEGDEDESEDEEEEEEEG